MTTPKHDAPQHGPRPLPLFLSLVDKITENDTELRTLTLEGLRRYQAADRSPPRPEAPIFATANRAMLRSIGGEGSPVILVPSLINPPHVLDLAPGNSLAGFLASNGHQVFLIDWGEPTPKDRDMGLADHVAQILLPLIQSFDTPPALIGYCLGGTLSIAAAALVEVRSLTTIAAPWHFAGYGEARRAAMVQHFRDGLPVAERLGLFPMEWIQAGFWSLDPTRTVQKFAKLASLPDGSAALNAFVALEDWANAGPPLPLATAQEMADILLDQDQPGKGMWQVDDQPINIAALSCPQRHFISLTDRIVPAETAPDSGTLTQLSLGHVGMVVGGRAEQLLWQPLSDWIHGA